MAAPKAIGTTVANIAASVTATPSSTNATKAKIVATATNASAAASHARQPVRTVVLPFLRMTIIGASVSGSN